MPSLRARLVNRYVRTKLKALPLPDIEPVKLRALMEAGSLQLLPKSVTRTQVTTPVRGEWQRPATTRPGRTIFYFHGGGYVFGSPRLMAPISCGVAAAVQAPVFSLDYRLAPQHPCPAAIEDALAAWDWLVELGTRPDEIFVGGDSAGGGIALAMMQTCAIGRRRYRAARSCFLHGRTLRRGDDRSTRIRKATRCFRPTRSVAAARAMLARWRSTIRAFRRFTVGSRPCRAASFLQATLRSCVTMPSG